MFGKWNLKTKMKISFPGFVGLGLVFGPFRLVGLACPPAFVRALARRLPSGRGRRVVTGVRRRSPRARGWPPQLRGLVKT
jgi:hypothetical protein